jgi:hypothetical protein
MLETDRREYRGIARYSFDRATASSRDIDENLGKPARLEEANTAGIAMTAVHKVY